MNRGVEDCILLRAGFNLTICMLSTVLRSIAVAWPIIVKLDVFIGWLLLIAWSLGVECIGDENGLFVRGEIPRCWYIRVLKCCRVHPTYEALQLSHKNL